MPGTTRNSGPATWPLAEAAGRQLMIEAGQEFLNVVRVGNGVHNKKYSITILDEAIGNFDDAIALIESGT